ncbi:MAG TPA: DegV family protein [Firmicutes bacterium]|nr:DegV family protein [Bacillota bacterium]
MTIRIVCDSTADLPGHLVEEYGIHIVPLKVHFGEEEYRDGVDITAGEFYQKLQTSPVLPTTSQPSPGEFVEVYRNLLEQGVDTIISIHISAQLSGTHHSAEVAKAMLPEADIEVIDSWQASTVLGVLVLEAARAARAGKSKEEILDLVRRLRERIRVFFMVDTLEYLQKGGRIGKAQAFLGSMLNIKPILTLEKGVIVPAAKVRGRAKAMEQLLAKMEAAIGTGRQRLMAMMHAANPEGMAELEEKARERWQPQEIIISTVGPVIGTHVGPGTLALIGIIP